MPIARLARIVALTAVLVSGMALPASAHAVLLDTDPGDGAVLDAAPGGITFFFDEEIESALAQIQVLDGGGARVDDGLPGSAEDGTAVTMAVSGGAEGDWRAAYRVVSSDGHPIQGQISFTVEPGADTEEGQTVADGHSHDAEVDDPDLDEPADPAADADDTAGQDASTPSEQDEAETAAIVEDEGTPLALLIAAGLLAGLTGLVMGLRRRRAR